MVLRGQQQSDHLSPKKNIFAIGAAPWNESTDAGALVLPDKAESSGQACGSSGLEQNISGIR